MTANTSCSDFLRTLRPNGPDFLHVYKPSGYGPLKCWGLDGYPIPASLGFGGPVAGIDLAEGVFEPLEQLARSLGWYWDMFDALITPEGIWVYNYSEDDIPEDVTFTKLFCPAGTDILQDIQNLVSAPLFYEVPLSEGRPSPRVLGNYDYGYPELDTREAHPSYGDEMNLASTPPEVLGIPSGTLFWHKWVDSPNLPLLQQAWSELTGNSF